MPHYAVLKAPRRQDHGSTTNTDLIETKQQLDMSTNTNIVETKSVDDRAGKVIDMRTQSSNVYVEEMKPVKQSVGLFSRAAYQAFPLFKEHSCRATAADKRSRVALRHLPSSLK